MNASRADLDVTLLPKNAALVYSPKSRTVSIETPSSPEDTSFNETGEPPAKVKKTASHQPMDTGKFYSPGEHSKTN